MTGNAPLMEAEPRGGEQGQGWLLGVFPSQTQTLKMH